VIPNYDPGFVDRMLARQQHEEGPDVPEPVDGVVHHTLGPTSMCRAGGVGTDNWRMVNCADCRSVAVRGRLTA
jgi:hypothetical protein